MRIEFESNIDDCLLGIHFMNYIDEYQTEGYVIQIGVVFFSINLYFN